MPKQDEEIKPIPMVKWSDIRTLEAISKLLEEHGMIYIIDPSNGIPIKVTRAGLH